MWPPSAASATRAPAPEAIGSNPVGVIRFSCSTRGAPWFVFQVLTASTLPEPTRPAIQPPVVWERSSVP